MSSLLVDPGEVMAAAVVLRRLGEEATDVRERLRRGGSCLDLHEGHALSLWWEAAGATRRVAEDIATLQEATRRSAQLYALRDAEIVATIAALGRARGTAAHEALLRLSEQAGRLTERGAHARVVEVAAADRGPRVSEDPRSLQDLVEGDAWLDGQRGRVRVVGLPQPDGSMAWVVMIPGTQSSDLVAGANPFDPTTDARIMNGESTVAAQGVACALAMAQRVQGREGAHDPVLLTGHSLGGIIAAHLASDATFRRTHDVRAVLAAGSPVDAFAVPSSIPVISLEHHDDPVPRTDGADSSSPALVRFVLPQRGVSALRSHDGALYARSAHLVDQIPSSRHPGLAAWRKAAQPFLGRGAGAGSASSSPPASPPSSPPPSAAPVVRDYEVRREWQNPRS